MLKDFLFCLIIGSFVSLDAQVDLCSPDSFVRFMPDSAGKLVYKSIYTYNERKQVLINTSYYFYSPKPQVPASWILDQRTENLYDADGLLTSYTHYLWNDTGWMFHQTMQYTYDSQGRPVAETKILEDWDGKLTNNFMETISYDSLGRESSRTWNQWDLTGQWTHTANVLHTYDDRHRLTRTVTSFLYADSTWKEKKKDSFNYTNDLLAEKTNYNRILDFWMTLERDTFEYNNEGMKTKRTHQGRSQSRWWNEYMDTFSYNHKGCLDHTDYFYVFSGPREWIWGSRDTFYYPRAGKMTIFYPNPAHDVLYLDAPAELPIVLTDLTGRTVFEAIIPRGESRIDISRLPSGMYFVNASGYAGTLIID